MKIKYCNVVGEPIVHDFDNKGIITPIEDIVQYDIKQKAIKTGDGEYDVSVQDEVVEISRIDRAEYIDSFVDDVGIINILNKVQNTGDVALLNQKHGVYGDVSNVPDTLSGAQSQVDAAKDKAAALGIDLTEEAIKAYIDKVLAEKAAEQGTYESEVIQ